MGYSKSALPGESWFVAGGSSKLDDALSLSVSSIMTWNKDLKTLNVKTVNNEFFERLGHLQFGNPVEFEATLDPNTAPWAGHSQQGPDHPHAPCHIPAPVKRRQTRSSTRVESPSPLPSPFLASQALPVPGPAADHTLSPAQPVPNHPDSDTAIVSTAATAEAGEKLSSPVTLGRTHDQNDSQDATNQITDQQGTIQGQQEKGAYSEKTAEPAPTTRASDWWSVVFS